MRHLKYMDERDVVIVGAGISGLYLSKELEKRGIDYITLEKRRNVGTDGPRIINLEIFETLGIPKSKMIRPIKKINFYSPSGSLISKKDTNVRGFVVNLRTIEEFLYNSIKDKSKIRMNYNAIDFDLENQVIKIANNGKIKFKALVLATGILGIKFRDKLRINHPKNVFCYAVEIEAKDDTTTILDNKLAPGFYGWVIPLKGDRLELGFGAEELNIRNKDEIHEKLFSLTHLKKYKHKKILQVNGGFIPTGMIERKAGKNWVVIGDAAGGEPMLGGSIHKCVDEAKIAADVLEDYITEKTASLRKYESVWDDLLSKELENQGKIRKMLDNSKNTDFDRIFKQLQGKEIEGKGLINDLFRNIVINLRNQNF